jgi:predicted TIM-barrel fold metal-dependent hydrolase
MPRNGYTIIDADTHILEPPNIWKNHLPKAYQKYAPKLVRDHEGGDAWDHGSGNPDPIGLVSTPGKRFEEFRWFGVRYSQIRKACYNGKERIKDMDIEGVDAIIVFPPERTIFRWLGQPDPAVSLAGIDAYNEFAQDEFAAADKTRIFPMYQIPSLGVDKAIEYAKKAAKAGARGVLLGSWPTGGASMTGEDDRFWAACEEMRLPVHVHIMLESREALVKQATDAQSATSGLQMKEGRRRAIAQYAGVFTRVTPIISQFLFSGVFDRFPKLQLVFVEVGVGWIPHFLEMVDDRYWRNRNWVEFDIKRPPSTYWYTNCAATFMHDHSGVKLRHSVGLANMLWSSDNPHHGNDWPYARKLITEMMDNVDPSEKDQLIAGNAMRIYGLEGMAPSRDGARAATAVRVQPKAASRDGARGNARAKAPSRNGARRGAAGRRAAARNGARAARRAPARSRGRR